MKKLLLVFVLMLCGCDKNAENKANFEACMLRAEQKFQQAHADICIHQAWHKEGECSYSIESNNALIRSKDNEITACAIMFAPSK